MPADLDLTLVVAGEGGGTKSTLHVEVVSPIARHDTAAVAVGIPGPTTGVATGELGEVDVAVIAKDAELDVLGQGGVNTNDEAAVGGIEVVVDVVVEDKTALAVSATGVIGAHGATKAAHPSACAIGLGVDGGEIGIVDVDVAIHFDGGNFNVDLSLNQRFSRDRARAL